MLPGRSRIGGRHTCFACKVYIFRTIMYSKVRWITSSFGCLSIHCIPSRWRYVLSLKVIGCLRKCEIFELNMAPCTEPWNEGVHICLWYGNIICSNSLWHVTSNQTKVSRVDDILLFREKWQIGKLQWTRAHSWLRDALYVEQAFQNLLKQEEEKMTGNFWTVSIKTWHRNLRQNRDSNPKALGLT